MANLKVLIESTDSDEFIQALIDRQFPAAGADMADCLIEYLQFLQGGTRAGSVLRFSAADAQASATAVLDTVIADDEITIGSKTLTCKAEPANENQFELGDNDAETTDNLAACINANTDLKEWLKAESDGVDTVTLTCLVAGSIGNNIPLSADSTITCSGTALENGADANNFSETM